MTKENGNRTFRRITNNDIYDKVCSLENRLQETENSIKLSRWMAGLAVFISISTIVAVVSIQ